MINPLEYKAGDYVLYTDGTKCKITFIKLASGNGAQWWCIGFTSCTSEFGGIEDERAFYPLTPDQNENS